MSKGFLTPGETAQATISAGIKKANISTQNAILLGLFGGAFIGFGALGSMIVSQTFGKIDPGVASFLSAMVFPVGLMLVVVAGAELFTGNTLMAIALMEQKNNIRKNVKKLGTGLFCKFSRFNSASCTCVLFFYIDRRCSYKSYSCGRS